MTDRAKWWWNGVVGALLLGSGISIAIESGFLKHGANSNVWIWVIGGTAGIGLVVSGVVLLVRAGILFQKIGRE